MNIKGLKYFTAVFRKQMEPQWNKFFLMEQMDSQRPQSILMVDFDLRVWTIINILCSELVGCTQLYLQTDKFELHFGLDYDIFNALA